MWLLTMNGGAKRERNEGTYLKVYRKKLKEVSCGSLGPSKT